MNRLDALNRQAFIEQQLERVVVEFYPRLFPVLGRKQQSFEWWQWFLVLLRFVPIFRERFVGNGQKSSTNTLDNNESLERFFYHPVKGTKQFV